MPLPIIDTHHHLWALGHGHYPWLEHAPITAHFGDYGAIRRDYLAADFRADTAGSDVVKSVHVQAEWDERDPVAETRWLEAQATAHAVPDAIVAFAALQSPDIAATLDAHMQASSRLRGIRMLLRKPNQLAGDPGGKSTLLDDPAWRRGFALLGPRQLAYDLQAPPPLMADAARLAADFPQTTIVLTHCGLPLDKSPEALAAWRAGVAALARCPNVVAKISGLGLVDRALRPDVLRPIVHHLLDSFGPARCMYGSNFPVDKLMSDYARNLGLARDLVRQWSPDAERQAVERAVFHDTAASTYRL
jgi:predicted TIM-barrel fold metal-dependent hydrolase